VNTGTTAYVQFCLHFGLEAMPVAGIPDLHLRGFILYLANSGSRSFKTIKHYLSMGPRTMQLEALGSWTPIVHRPSVLLTLTAARRILGDASTPKLAITPAHLRGFLRDLDFGVPDNVVLFTAYLVGFWAFLRKGNLVPGRSSDFSDRQILRFKDVRFDAQGRAWLTLRNTKTIQFGERVVTLPLALLPASDVGLCPSTWLRKLLTAAGDFDPEAPLFSLPPRGARRPCILSYDRFRKELKRLLALQGVDYSKFSGHSFRRGGATFAHASGVAPAFIKLQGDWLSDCYELYVSSTVAQQLTAVLAMEAGLHHPSCG